MRLYYEADGVQLWHGDAREVLPTLEAVDLLLTDPPYPGLKAGLVATGYQMGGVAPGRHSTAAVAEPWGGDIGALSLAKFTKGALVFWSYHSVTTLPALFDARPACLITWYQRNAPPRLANLPHFQSEFIWAFRGTPGLDWHRLRTVYDVPSITAGCVSTGERLTQDGGKALHPTQKPLALISQLLDLAPASVVDPYAGTGTTLLACKRRGIRCVGVELSERYCELAANRLRSTPLPLFTLPAAPDPPRQMEIAL
jgi:hypothetical protein